MTRALCAVCVIFAGCTRIGAHPAGGGDGLGSGDHEISLRHGGPDSGSREALIGAPTTLVDGAAEVWRFFEGRTR